MLSVMSALVVPRGTSEHGVEHRTAYVSVIDTEKLTYTVVSEDAPCPVTVSLSEDKKSSPHLLTIDRTVGELR